MGYDCEWVRLDCEWYLWPYYNGSSRIMDIIFVRLFVLVYLVSSHFHVRLSLHAVSQICVLAQHTIERVS